MKGHAAYDACIIVTVWICLGGCTVPSNQFDPNTLPYRFTKVIELGDRVQVVDLDGDREDEIVQHMMNEGPGGYSSLMLSTQRGNVIGQVHIAGRIDGALHFLGQVLTVLELPTPPPPGPTCGLCQYLGEYG